MEVGSADICGVNFGVNNNTLYEHCLGSVNRRFEKIFDIETRNCSELNNCGIFYSFEMYIAIGKLLFPIPLQFSVVCMHGQKFSTPQLCSTSRKHFAVATHRTDLHFPVAL